MLNYFIADTHFFHAQLLGNNDFAPRLFETTAAMNQAMIEAWNSRVDENDVVYHLGDIAMNPGDQPDAQAVFDILNQLNGQIVLIKGNHDSRALFKFINKQNYEFRKGQMKFKFHDVGALIKFDHAQYYLTHYPMLMGIVKQIVNLHGHIHHNMVPIAEDINVGVDAPEREFLSEPLPFGAPLKEEEIEEIFEKKQRWLAQQKG